MNAHNLVPIIFIVAALAYLAWSVARSRRWEKYQGEAADRSKTIIEATSRDRERLEEAISISREQLQVEKELLSEIKGLREDLRRNGRDA
jgi:hypothetical protein